MLMYTTIRTVVIKPKLQLSRSGVKLPSMGKSIGKRNSALLQDAQELLGKTPLKVTKARVAILTLLLREHGPFSIEDIHSRSTGSGLDLVTAYRSLASMEEHGLVKKVNMGDAIARYELIHEHDHHHHIMCTICRKIESIRDCLVEKLERKVAKLGYSQIHHSLEFYGVCKSCNSNGSLG